MRSFGLAAIWVTCATFNKIIFNEEPYIYIYLNLKYDIEAVAELRARP